MTTEGSVPPSTPAVLPRRRRAPWWIAVGVVVIAAVTGIALVSGSGDGPPSGSSPGAVAPDFAVADLRDRDALIRLSDARGTPVVLNFFASWCTPCRKEMPALQAAAKRLRGKVAFIGIDHKDSRTEALELLESTGASYPTGFDQKGEVLRRYGLPDALPITLFLDEKGVVVERKVGELSRAKLDDALDRLLAG